MKQLAVLFVLFCVCLSSFFAQEVISVEVRGLGDIVNGKKEVAFDKAVEDALRRALEQAVGTFISQDSLSRNVQLIKDTIFKKSEGFIKTYEIINEEIDSANEIVWVTVSAQVMAAEVEQTLKDLLESIGTISTFVMIEGHEMFRLRLINDLISNGIEVVDRELLNNALDKQKAAMDMDQSKNVEQVGLWFWSKYILRGTAEHGVEQMEVYGNPIDLVSFQYNLELLDSTTGSAIRNFTNYFSRQGQANNNLINLLANQALGDIYGKIPRAFLDHAMDKKVVDFIVIGIDDFERRLREVPGISSLDNVETYGDRVKYKLRYNGNLNTLLSRIRELGFETERYQGAYYIRKVQKTVQVIVRGCSFADMKTIREAFVNVRDLGFSANSVSFSLEGDVFAIAEQLDGLGYQIIEINENHIEAKRGG